MARRRSVVRRAGAGRRASPAFIIAVLLAVGAAVLVIARVGRVGFFESAMRGGDDVAASASQVAAGPARSSGNVFERIGDMWNATSEIERLKRENRDLQAWRGLAERLAERNARYEALLRMPPDSFGEGADIEHSIAAQLVLDSGGPFTRTLVANAGADHGVKVGFIAVNENGLVGRVVSVGRRSARILMLDDYNSRIPVMGQASRVRAVLAGQATQAPDLLMGPFQMQAPRLDFIVGAQSLREGERVVTSGDGGLYPRGVPVGVARRGGDGAWRVVLAVGRAPIDFVRLIPYVGAEAPEQTAVSDSGPPASARSSVAAIDRATTPPAASARTFTLETPRPRVTTATTTPTATADQTEPQDTAPEPPGPATTTTASPPG